MKSEWGSGGNANDSIENCDWRRARILVFDLNVYIYIYMCICVSFDAVGFSNIPCM